MALTRSFLFAIVASFFLPAILWAQAPVPEVILVRGDHNFPPYEFLDETGRPAGFNIDLIRAVCETMDLQPNIQLGSWQGVRRQLEEGQIDLLSGMAYSPERDQKVDFSEAHSLLGLVLFVREGTSIQSLADLRGRQLIVQRGSIMHDFALKNNLSSQLITVQDSIDGLRLLASGEHDAALLAEMQGRYLLRKFRLTNLKVLSTPISNYEYCFAVKEADTALRRKLNQGLAIVKRTNRYREIRNKWFGVLQADSPANFSAIFRMLIWWGLAVLFLLATSLLWSFSLKQKVHSQTERLQRELAERKQAQEEIARLAKFPDEDPNPVLRVSSEGVIWYGNNSSAPLLAHWHCRQGESLPEPWRRQIAEVLAQGQSREVEVQCGDQSFALTLAPIAGADYLNVYGHNITELKRAEEERRKLESKVWDKQRLESLGILAGGVAHDFNNLLSGILGNADLALMDLPADSPAVVSLEGIRTSAYSAAKLTNQMLAYSGKGQFVLQPVNLTELVKQMDDLLRASISKKITLKQQLAPNLPDVEADITQMRQLLMSLVSNAAEAIGDEACGTITIRTGTLDVAQDTFHENYLSETHPGKAHVCLTVSDTGAGMTQEVKSKLFDPFFTTKFTGRGLGLAAVQGIVRGHGGAIQVQSELHKGSTFQIVLPCGQRPTPKPATAAAPTGQTDNWQGSGTILVADDEPHMRVVCKAILEKCGFDVLLAEDGQQALELFREHAADLQLVLLDLTMPKKNGDEVFQELCQIRPDIKVILVSGYNESEVNARFGGRGLTGFIHKPFDAAKLRRSVQAALDEQQV